jgi:hypothetical protein
MISKGKISRPFFVLLYGVPKIGKTHLAALAPEPVFLDVEQGSSGFDVARVDGVIDTYEKLTHGLREIYKSPDFKTCVIDSVTAIERIFTAHLLKENNWQTLESPGYGKGYGALTGLWQHFIGVCESMRNGGKNVLLIGHQRIKPTNDPMVDSYDRIELDVTKNASSSIVSATDAVLYYRWKTRVKKGENGKKSVGLSSGDREIYCQERAGFLAGNRFGLDMCVENPDENFWKGMNHNAAMES